MVRALGYGRLEPANRPGRIVKAHLITSAREHFLKARVVALHSGDGLLELLCGAIPATLQISQARGCPQIRLGRFFDNAA